MVQSENDPSFKGDNCQRCNPSCRERRWQHKPEAWKGGGICRLILFCTPLPSAIVARDGRQGARPNADAKKRPVEED